MNSQMRQQHFSFLPLTEIHKLRHDFFTFLGTMTLQLKLRKYDFLKAQGGAGLFHISKRKIGKLHGEL